MDSNTDNQNLDSHPDAEHAMDGRERIDPTTTSEATQSESEFPADPGMGLGLTETETDADADEGATDEPLDPEAEAEERADAEEAAAAYARASMRDFDAPPPEAIEAEADEPLEAHRGEKPKQLVIVNDVPGDETRIAILEQGKLMQFFSERAATSTNVGSIYKARVVNVEPAIQAAFVDFGEGANGFLHISDLHPKYFPGEKDTGEKVKEKVGRKIPRRSRPLMQDALRRGQEITVQVLKEGLGSKGPTVTSYLSIPGRLLVMMPDMDNVGVSRKVDDEEGRRKMRKILDSLDLREGFGFILRTAGFDATRTELARDAQYLTRLWDVMDKRMNAVGAPCQLYAEGDILLRTIRDSIDSSVDGIVCDSESAFSRARAFLEVVSPRTATKVHFWDRRQPIFHAFDVERQVDMIHAREVPLPSGGALVIDQTEALVAIDVNSGRSRSARDSETNAYQTNQEAVDEIARQLRLRDLGGVIVSDLIDMRASKHRREIEDRLKQHLAKDRAKSTVTEISEFGIVEMTRQRMRPSLRKTHYMDCPHCAGLGEIRMPDTVASDAMRRIQFVLDTERVARIEVVCSSKVAAILLSKKRRAMVELEDLFQKKIDVRISEAIAVDRVDIYAYDDRNADVEFEKPRKFQLPSLASLPTEIEEDEESESSSGGARPEAGQGGGRRRRRRRRKPAAADATSIILSGGFDDLPEIDEDEPSVSAALDAEEAEAESDEDSGDESSETRESRGGERREEGDGGRRGGRRRRRRRGGRGRNGEERAEGQGQGQGQGQPREPRGPRVAPKPVAPPPPPREPSDPIRVHALAKEIELTSKEVLAKCAELGIEVKGHQSLLNGEQGDQIRKAYGKPPFDVPEPTPEPPADETQSGATGEAGEAGEGGRRRKRRRRRRGGRRNRDGSEAADGAAADAQSSGQPGDEDGDESDADGDVTDSESESTEARAPRASRNDDAGEDTGEETGAESTDGDDDADGDGDGDGAESSEGSEGGNGGDGDQRGGRRRRRRRRGGRGRNRDAGESPNANAGGNAGGESRAAQPPRAENRGGEGRGSDGRGGDRRDNNRGGDGNRRDRGRRGGGGGRDRDRDRDRNSRPEGNGSRGGDSPKPAAPAPAPAPAPAATPPKPRSLYGGRVRKLAPGERPKGGGDE